MSTRITLAVAATFALGTAASAATIDFNDEDIQGQAISTATSSDGTISADLTVTGGVAQAVVFDTTTASLADEDLRDPFRRPGEPAPGTVRPGGVLIIQENADGIPDDNASGGTITFDFANAINFNGFRVFDGATITVTSTGSDSSFEAFVPEPPNEDFGNRFFDEFDVTGMFDNVTDLTFTFQGSGAIDDLQVAAVPLPAGILLLGGGLAAFGGFGSWRKRKQA